MRRSQLLVLSFTLVVVTGCYHQVVETGLTPTGPVINRTAGVMFWGLAGAEVDATAECASGVAVVETQQTFLNGLLAVVTLGIYTPQTVSITCAAGDGPVPDGPEVTVSRDATSAEANAAAQKAVTMATLSQQPVILRFVP